MKKTFSKAVAWLKGVIETAWEASDYIEIPSVSQWHELHNFPEINKVSVKEAAELLGLVPLVLVVSWFRMAIVTVYGAVGMVVVAGALLWKLATFWKKP